MEWHANYTFRKSILEKAQYRELSDQGILFKPGNSGEQLISYSTISSVRLRFQPYNRYRHNNYCCTIKVGSRTFDILSTHHVDVAKFNDQAGAYTVFVQELVKKTRI
ncbi:hypothetical protein [Sphingobacterium lumbrici]|uniref:hypothetical protein n=1 Tax=Sphingobacterium lumbrici TaxID=2559600 RepID=UPI00112DAB43|nr:hypothetical protein [Sphingobacterium lumbrici]